MKLTSQQIREALDLAVTGMTYTEIARRFGVPPGTIGFRLQPYKVRSLRMQAIGRKVGKLPSRAPAGATERKERMRQLKREGWSLREISNEFGVSYQRISQILNESDTPQAPKLPKELERIADKVLA